MSNIQAGHRLLTWYDERKNSSKAKRSSESKASLNNEMHTSQHKGEQSH